MQLVRVGLRHELALHQIALVIVPAVAGRERQHAVARLRPCVLADIGLQAFLQQHYVQWGILMAASAIFTIPMIVLFFFAQKYFIEGITVTGVKG